MKFRFRVLEGGQERRGTIEAASADVAREMLSKKGQIILSIDRIWAIPNPFRRGAPMKDLIAFTRQFAAMYKARVDVIRSLGMLIDQITNKEFAAALRRVRDEIANGRTLSQALALESRFFHGLYVEVVRLGELSGDLHGAFNQIATLLQREMNLKRMIRKATAYPVVLMLITLGVACYMMVFVLPEFETHFAASGSELPMLTFVVLRLGRYIASQWWVILLALIGGGVYLNYYVQTPVGRANLDRLLLTAPLVSPLYRRVTVSQFANTFSILMHSNLPVLDAMRTSARLTQNVIIMAQISRARSEIQNGSSIADALRAVDAFPPTFHHLVATGEATGELTNILNAVATDLSDEAEDAMESISTIIEPVMLVFLACVVGVIVLSVFLPMVDSLRLIQM